MLIDLLLKRRLEIKNTPIPQLPLELAVIEWCANGQDKQSKQITQIKQQEKEEIKQSPSPPALRAGNPYNLTLKDVANKWDEFINKIEKKSTSLAFILKSSTLHSVSNNTVCVAVAFSLHKEKILDKICKIDIEIILSEVMNEKIKIDAIVSEKKESEKKDIDMELQDLTAAFGGEIVN